MLDIILLPAPSVERTTRRQGALRWYLCISPGHPPAWGRGSGRTRYSPSRCSPGHRYTSPHCCKSAKQKDKNDADASSRLLPTNLLFVQAAKSLRRTHPVMRADARGRGRGARAGAEVEGGDGEAAALRAHHVRPARRPVLHVAHVQAVVQHGVAAPVGSGGGHTRSPLFWFVCHGPIIIIHSLCDCQNNKRSTPLNAVIFSA